MPATFNKTAFSKQQFEPRTAQISMPALKQWFSDGDEKNAKIEFTVRGLSGHEVAQSLQAVEDNNAMSLASEAISNGKSDKLSKIKAELGIFSDETPADLAKRMKMLELGCVEPELDMPIIIKLVANFPIEFYQLSSQITALTGLGFDVKK